ncbi:MAG: hypothetical protein ACYTGZ_02030 [Planctomycetota bacterium]
MSALAPLLLAAVALVSDGKPVARLEHDGSAAAMAAAEIFQRHVVLVAKTALPEKGAARAIRFETSAFNGYRIESREGNVVVSGRYPVLAAYDLLRDWGCRFDAADPHLPEHTTLAVKMRVWRNDRPLAVEGDGFDPALPAVALAVRGLANYPKPHHARATALGYDVRVASTTFDDFLPPALFDKHPNYFALRRGERAARGNFALTNPAARKEYLDRVEAWLTAHPEVDVLGIWPEVTTVWCEESIKLGRAEAYALLWRAAAKRFPLRRFEILATGATLKPPAGRVPDNVEVRLRPGRDANLLQPLAGQPIGDIARAWELRGARVLLATDAAPPTWCGLPWPCHDAVRGNARHFGGAVLVRPTRVLAELWHRPGARVAIDAEMADLLKRARTVSSWGDPRDAARLWPQREDGSRTTLGARMGEVERTVARAMRADLPADERCTAAAAAWFGFRHLVHDLGEEHGRTYRRLRERDFRAMLAELLPDGAETRVAGARVLETFDTIIVETVRLRLGIERKTATVTELRRRVGREWSADLAGAQGRVFAVVGLRAKTDRVDGEVRVRGTGDGELRIELAGRLHRGGPRWKSVLVLDGSSASIRQTAEVAVPGGIAAGCKFAPDVLDEWVCPSYATEGRFTRPDKPKQASFRLVPGSIVYCRKGPRGVGIALRLPHGGVGAIVDGEDTTMISTSPSNRIVAEWIVFRGLGELGN